MLQFQDAVGLFAWARKHAVGEFYATIKGAWVSAYVEGGQWCAWHPPTGRRTSEYLEDVRAVAWQGVR